MGVLTDPLRFMAGLETLASIDYSLCIKAGVHFTLCGGKPFLRWSQIAKLLFSHYVQGQRQECVLTRL